MIIDNTVVGSIDQEGSALFLIHVYLSALNHGFVALEGVVQFTSSSAKESWNDSIQALCQNVSILYRKLRCIILLIFLYVQISDGAEFAQDAYPDLFTP